MSHHPAQQSLASSQSDENDGRGRESTMVQHHFSRHSSAESVSSRLNTASRPQTPDLQIQSLRGGAEISTLIIRMLDLNSEGLMKGTGPLGDLFVRRFQKTPGLKEDQWLSIVSESFFETSSLEIWEHKRG